MISTYQRLKDNLERDGFQRVPDINLGHSIDKACYLK